MKMLEISIELAPPPVNEGFPIWDVTVMTSGVGRRYVVPDPAEMGPVHAVQDVLTFHLGPNNGRTVPGFSALPKAQDTP